MAVHRLGTGHGAAALAWGRCLLVELGLWSLIEVEKWLVRRFGG
ncbi:MAG: hypothetical protein V4812_08495 [Pseudomonadota bacterium]